MIEVSSRFVTSIPSPSFNSLDVGPLTFTLYGLMIGLGIIAATSLARARAPKRNLHPDVPLEMLVWVVPAGLIGTRIYHIITDWVPISQWHKIWEGGLGIPGGIMAGAVAGIFFTKHRNLSTVKVADVVAPSLPLAQAIGRIGNWWNQELYGRPTDLPWALEIDAEYRRPGFEDVETFHPTFLYETLWNLGLVGFLLWLDRKRILKPGRLIWVYAAGYAIGRLWIESVRIDNATEIFGARVNIWMMSIVLLVSLVILRTSFQRQPQSGDADVSTVAAGMATGEDTDEEDTDEDDDAAEDAEGSSSGATKTATKKSAAKAKTATKAAAAKTATSAKNKAATTKTSTSKTATSKTAKKSDTATKKSSDTKSAADKKAGDKAKATTTKKPSDAKKAVDKAKSNKSASTAKKPPDTKKSKDADATSKKADDSE